MAGLRERKKRETRIALSQAAIRLCLERGWAAVTVDDIAAAADVSPRTFRNYFASKGEAIAAMHLERTERIAEELRARPADEPFWDAIVAAVHGQYSVADDSSPGSRAQAALRLLLAEPALSGEILKADATARVALTAAIAERTGTDPADLYPMLVAAVVGAGTSIAVERCLHAARPTPLGPVLREVFAQIAAGLPTPHSD
jgi:AcrR family transcriptional regulator